MGLQERGKLILKFSLKIIHVDAPIGVWNCIIQNIIYNVNVIITKFYELNIKPKLSLV